MELEKIETFWLSEEEQALLKHMNHFPVNKTLMIDPSVQEELLHRLSGSPLEEQIWEKVFTLIDSKNLSEKVIRYFVDKEMLVQTLCHMELPDYWLQELMRYDDMPLFTLAKRHYNLDEYSAENFIDLFYKYIAKRVDVIVWLFKFCPNSNKQHLLTYLCKESAVDDAKIYSCMLVNTVRSMKDTGEIRSIYENNKDDGDVLLAIAENIFTDRNVLESLSQQKGILNASGIRQACQRNLALKKKIQSKQ